jgi:hypothetical protein
VIVEQFMEGNEQLQQSREAVWVITAVGEASDR